MKMVAEYLAEAIEFQQMAADAKNPELKSALEKKAAAYRNLAIDRTKKLGMPPPETSSQSN